MKSIYNQTLLKAQKIFLNSPTFWDADLNTLDLIKNNHFIIARIAERGNDKEINFMLTHFSKSDILFAINHLPEITPRTKNYFNIILE